MNADDRDSDHRTPGRGADPDRHDAEHDPDAEQLDAEVARLERTVYQAPWVRLPAVVTGYDWPFLPPGTRLYFRCVPSGTPRRGAEGSYGDRSFPVAQYPVLVAEAVDADDIDQDLVDSQFGERLPWGVLADTRPVVLNGYRAREGVADYYVVELAVWSHDLGHAVEVAPWGEKIVRQLAPGSTG